MAEKTTPKKRPPRQQMLEGLGQAEKAVAERREAQARPEEKVEAKAAAEAVAGAEELAAHGVVKSIGELKATIGGMLGELSDRLEELVARYTQVQRAIAAKDQELKEIFEIQRSASTLTALIETHERQQAEMEKELADTRQSLEKEIEETRKLWEEESKLRDADLKERDAAEQKRRDREKDEYRYAWARDTQQAKDKFADEMAKVQKDLAERKAAAEKDMAEREKAMASREQELAELRQRAEAFPAQLDAAVAKAAEETAARLNAESKSREELLKRDFAGEKNVLSTRIVALEKTVKEQAEQLARLQQQAEKAYVQVQEIAVRAIEGSASAKHLANLQQMLAEQTRKPPQER